jgi:hypothetical protein
MNKNLSGAGGFIDKELASRAGKKSGEVRRQRAELRKIALEALCSNCPDTVAEKLKSHFPDLPEKSTNFIGMIFRAIASAHNGDIKAFKTICEVAGVTEQNVNLEGNLETNNTVEVRFVEPENKEPDKE